jgi:acyl-CoA dehydrogenase
MGADRETMTQFLDVLDRFVRERLIPNEEKVSEDDQIPDSLVDEIPGSTSCPR